MKKLILLAALCAIGAKAQLVTLQGGDPLKTSRTTINNNFTYLNNNKAGLSACPVHQFAIQTAVGGVVCAALITSDVPTLNQDTTGTAAKATALAATPTQCSAGQYFLGIAAGGNANGCTAISATLTTLSIPMPIGIVQGTTAATGVSLPSNNAPLPTTVIGTNTILGVLAFPAGSTTTFQYHIRVPYNADCTQAWNIIYVWRAASTTNTMTWQIETVFVADGAVVDPAFNTASTVAHAPQGTTLQLRSDTIANFTKTGCAVNTEIFIRGSRLGTGGDTMAGDAQLVSATLQIPRTL